MQGFNGFTDDTTRFLTDLETHNDKAWFEANRARYDEAWLQPAAAFVDALGRRLQKLAPGVQYEAKLDRSIVRIHRDQRFTTKKLPYKTHFELRFWLGDRQRPAFWWRLGPDALLLAVGVPYFEAKLLAQYRAKVAGAGGASLSTVASALTRRGVSVEGQRRKTVPPPYATDHRHADWLKHDGLYAADEDRVPRALKKAELVDHCVARYRAMVPLLRWLEKLG